MLVTKLGAASLILVASASAITLTVNAADPAKAKQPAAGSKQGATATLTLNDAEGKQNALRDQMKIVLLGMHNYHDVHNEFPPAYTCDADGKPLHSWRTLILPYIDQERLSKEFDLTVPWDVGKNAEMGNTIPAPYLNPYDKEGGTETPIQVVVGPDGAFGGCTGRGMRDFTDGTSNTILIVASPSVTVQWSKPADLSSDAVINNLAQLAAKGEGEILIGIADGSVRSIPVGTAPERIRAMLTHGGGEPLAN